MKPLTCCAVASGVCLVAFVAVVAPSYKGPWHTSWAAREAAYRRAALQAFQEFSLDRMADTSGVSQAYVRVEVGGNVMRPGRYRLDARSTAGDAVAAAGGVEQCERDSSRLYLVTLVGTQPRLFEVPQQKWGDAPVHDGDVVDVAGY